VPVWLAVSGRAPETRLEAIRGLGVEILSFPGEGPIPIPALQDELGRRGLTNLLVEGGGRVLGSFVDAGEVDAVEVFVAPIIEGGDHPVGPVRGLGVSRMAESLRLACHEVRLIDGDVALRGHVARPWLEPVDRT
jgi:diaminohydroxyphosphoribosylaminopyrimidine deaminase/5-amino-6-(5-phosphoribosylamino)uracil reductase